MLGAAGISRVTLAVAASGWIASVSFTALRVGQLTVRRHRRLGVLALVSSIIVAGATGWLGLGGRIEPRWAPFLVRLAFVLAISVIYLPAKKPRSDGKLRV